MLADLLSIATVKHSHVQRIRRGGDRTRRYLRPDSKRNGGHSRQGRISFYMPSAGEEAISVGSGSVLDGEDVVFAQYREQGLFKQRGFTTEEFMSQVLANKNDHGHGRNMPIHYGSKKLNIVCRFALAFPYSLMAHPDLSHSSIRSPLR